jgi:hypothetical protein
MNVAAGYHELADVLGQTPEAFRKSRWQTMPHFFVGTGRDLRSARFDVADVLSYLKDRDYRHVNHSIPTGRETGIQGQGQAPGAAVHLRRVLDSGGSAGVDGRKKKGAKSPCAESPNRFDVFSGIQRVHGRLRGEDATDHRP